MLYNKCVTAMEKVDFRKPTHPKEGDQTRVRITGPAVDRQGGRVLKFNAQDMYRRRISDG